MGYYKQNLSKKNSRKQQLAARLMFSDDIYIPSKLLMKELNILNIYQINILQHLLLSSKSRTA